MKKLLFVSLMLATFVFAPIVNADVINGSFEDPALGYGSWNASYTSIPGWVATFGTIEIQNHAAGDPFDGNQLAELDSWSNSGMMQDVPTVAGHVYDFYFAYSPRPYVSSASNIINVYFEGALLGAITGYSSPNTNWTIHHYIVTATDSSSTIAFQASGISESLGGYLDAVHFIETSVSVPEPASFLLFGIGMAGIGLVRNRFKK